MTTAAALGAKTSSPVWIIAVGGGALLASLGALVLFDGNPALMLAAPFAVGGVYLVRSLPLRTTVLGLLFLELLCEGLEITLSGYWDVPLQPLARMLLVNLNAVTGISPLRASFVDIACIALWVASRFNRSPDVMPLSNVPSIRFMHVALFGTLGTIAALYVLGVAQGGNGNEALWQFRQVAMFPFRTFLFLSAFDASQKELKLVAKVVIIAACIKSFIGFYFLYGVVYPEGKYVEFTTSHSDTVLFIPLIAMAFNLFWEDPRWPRIRRLMTWVPIVMMGMVLNDRRLAYVSLGGAIVCTFLMSPWTRVKRSVVRTLVVLAPILAIYFSLGWERDGRVFFVAQLVKSIVKGDQAQEGADYRDMENFNVLFSWSEHSIVPSGFGHKMIEAVTLPDISRFMPTYQYHPHNQYLWYLSIGGPIGFTLMFLPLSLAVFLAARTYSRVKAPLDRAACLTLIGTVIACLNQLYGDMGTLSYTVSFMSALAIALSVKLAVRHGAWPAASPKPRFLDDRLEPT